MGEIHKLNANIELKNSTEPVPEVVALLEDFLERAKQGHIRSIAVAGEAFIPGEDTPGITSSWARSPNGSSYVLLGAMSYLMHRINKRVDEA